MKNTLSTSLHKVILFAFLFFSFSTCKLYSQHVQLTNIKSGKQLKPIREGMRVRYLLYPSDADIAPVAKTGILTKITSTALTIDNKTINIENLEGFGRKKKGSNFFGWFLTSLGNRIWIGSIVDAVTPDVPPCTNCNVYVKESATSKLGPYVFTGLGLGVTYLGIRTLVRNSKRNLASNWELEVVEK